MRIVIDLQGCQTKHSAQRGIGRYSFAHTQALAKQCHLQHDDLRIAFNGLFPDTIQPLKQRFNSVLPDAAFSTYTYPPDFTHPHELTLADRLVAHHYAQLKPDIIHVTSPFEATNPGGIVPHTALNFPSLSVSATLYDLIPLIYKETYLDHNKMAKHAYFKVLEFLKKCDLLLSISEATRQDAIHYLNIPEHRIINISGAVDEQFKPLNLTPKETNSLKDKYNIQKKFILYTGGINYRKNIEALIKAYSDLPEKFLSQYQLTIVCKCRAHDKQRLLSLAKKHNLPHDAVLLTGYIPDEDLIALYNLCDLFVFPPLYEGFGLPVLEAMSCGAPTIGSNTSSIPEIIQRPDALFDPKKTESITRAIHNVLSDDAFKADLKEHGLTQAKKFSWEKSARIALDAYKDLHNGKNRSLASTVNHQSTRKKIAYFSPLPNQISGIADYSAELLRELKHYFEIDLFIDTGYKVEDTWLKNNFDIFTYKTFPEKHKNYDAIIYQLGNSPLHSYMHDLFSQYPGIIVMHDFFLSESIVYHSASPIPLKNLIENSHGKAALDLLNHGEKGLTTLVEKFPLNKHILDTATGLIFHSPYSQKLIEEHYAKNIIAPTKIIKLLRAPKEKLDRLEARKQLGISENDFLVCTFGVVHPNKLIKTLFDAFNCTNIKNKNHIKLIYVGKRSIQTDAFVKTVKHSDLASRIIFTNQVESKIYRQYLAAADITVQLRTHTRGETSAAALDCLSAGKPLILNNYAAFTDYSDDIVYKVPAEVTPKELAKAIIDLYENPEKREALSARALSYTQEHHDPKKIAKQYAIAIEKFIQQANAADQKQLIKELAKIIDNHDVDNILLSKIAKTAIYNTID